MPSPTTPKEDTLTVREVAERGDAVLSRIEEVIVGKREPLTLILGAILAGGHVLLEDYPGLAKTLAARCFSWTLGLSFRRIQFTPDLLPADIVGTHLYRREEGQFEFRPGPIFAQLILADEINRATPKTQSALLEAMQEGQATVEGDTRPLPQPFVVLATQNPIEYEGTFPLPEAQVDRFLVRVRFGYPEPPQEEEILRRRIAREREEVSLPAVTGPEEVLALRQALEEVYVDPDLLGYMVALVAATRRHPSLAVGASPRGTLALLKISRARAALAGRDYVLPDDVKAVAGPALAHRLILSPELWTRDIRAEDIIADILAQTPVPKAG
ncbi:MAG TPA: MoxR family ATPase [Candidatus Bipolaricaulis anaerobius]|jgi:MoxR-like ATPase|uniref:AAA family ATPase n=1 Tax=Candidatus Bipolaricaulis anaerobius TaxID=2026885 RepID=UPI000EFC72D0|nr:MoxR family ATPase [Candidatus Bipolaricaulis anaerobius]MDD5763704.1 MoxR family ATPase [Candidatus Bipolaricaulis anaerobius]HNR23986.1 MoxR family ATPase [Candidatus Bipolaricaulis anaerobius]HNS23931.1 MoxR family ATPase [Candidatus Bipolaricaulis anaerobius]HQM37819.1 MoxR family ATPase [Candidatus Bipolaricaulis anaerobius]